MESQERDQFIRDFQRGRLRLIAYIRTLVGDPDLTEDLFQEVSVVVLQKAAEFRTGGDLAAWCRGIARNLVLRERRNARRLRAFADDRIVDLVDASFAEADAEDLLDRKRSLLRLCLDLLAESARQLVDGRYVEGLSLRDLAARVQKTEAAVQVSLSRVRKWLSDCVERRGDPEAGLQT